VNDQDQSTVTPRHRLAPLSAEEIVAAASTVRSAGGLGEGSVVAHVVLHEPPPAAIGPRRAELLEVPGPQLAMVSWLVDLEAGSATPTTIEGMRPALLMGESFGAVVACVEHPEYVAALAKRGITDLSLVQIDPWPAGVFGYEAETDRRIARCISFLREFSGDNAYARPIEGVIVHVDLGRGEVIEVIDHGVVPMASTHGRYGTADHQPSRTLAPLRITQPDGPGFTVDDGLLTWHRWRLRVGFDPTEGVVLHEVEWDDGERVRPVARRLSVSEMVVPYGEPGPIHGWKNAFDAGEWGLGRMTQSLVLGCDCLGEIQYLDAVMANETGEPWVVSNAICLHEEDFGILWKHVDLWSGGHEVRRHRRMVIQHVATVGNYEYAFAWHLYVDGQIGLEVRLTGILSTASVEGDPGPYMKRLAPGLAAPVHQHLFCVRLDMTVDGTDNVVDEVDVLPAPAGPQNPWGNAFAPTANRLLPGGDGRDTNAATSRIWKVSNPATLNRNGDPTSYALIPTMATPTLLASADSSVGRRAAFARHNLWVTRADPARRHASGDFPNQHVGGDGIPAWVAQDAAANLAESAAGEDVVLWYTFGLTHIPRPEDWPVMPVEWTGFLLTPKGFFDANPTLELAPESAGDSSCH